MSLPTLVCSDQHLCMFVNCCCYQEKYRSALEAANVSTADLDATAATSRANSATTRRTSAAGLDFGNQSKGRTSLAAAIVATVNEVTSKQAAKAEANVNQVTDQLC